MTQERPEFDRGENLMSSEFREKLNALTQFSVSLSQVNQGGFVGHQNSNTRFTGGPDPRHEVYIYRLKPGESWAKNGSDTVESALCKIVYRTAAGYAPYGADVRVYNALPVDPSPADGENFYATLNRQSGRWEVIGAGGTAGIHDGIVVCHIGSGVYKVELAELAYAADDDCPSSAEDLCADWNACPDPLPECPDPIRLTPTGTGEYVLAYDPRPLPIPDNTHVVIGKIQDDTGLDRGSGVSSASAVTSSLSDNISKQWRVLRSQDALVCLDWVTSWKCEVDCDGVNTGNIIPATMKRVLVSGIECAECTVNVLECSSS